MATAPTPGQTSEPQAVIIRVDDKAARLVVEDLGPVDARLFRKANVGITLAAAISAISDAGSMDLDVPCSLWWLARVRNGETQLAYQQAESEFPGYADFQDRVEISVEEPEDLEDGSPEA